MPEDLLLSSFAQSAASAGPFEFREEEDVTPSPSRGTLHSERLALINNASAVPRLTVDCAQTTNQSGISDPQLYTAASTDQDLVRYLDCRHYGECLDLAAALNWSSFTCSGCSGDVNPSLLWRAHQSTRKDSLARHLCGLRPITMLRGEKK